VSKIGGLYSKDYAEIDRFINYVFYGLMPAASLNLGRDFARMKASMEKDPSSKDVAKKGVENIKKRLPEWQKEYFPAMDKDIVTALLIAVKKEVKADLLPPVINEILASKVVKKGKNDEEKFRMWVDNAFATSVVTNKAAREKFFATPDLKVLQNDPIVTLANGVVAHFRDKLAPKYYEVQGQSEELAKDYIAGLRLANPGKNFYPDANSTMRLTYGKVKSYDPQDGMHYHYLTTFDGVIAKEDNKNPEFEVPKKLHDLWERKDYGQYATVSAPDGSMTVPVCFLTTNDITGGNSGSAVINGNGEIIGCAFDGNWEAMAGDIHVFPNLNRTIAVDIRYVLFIVEKFAGAKNIIEELEIRK
ncbi:MAG: S46 family peptidase, partial [Bacteroidia bacterium]